MPGKFDEGEADSIIVRIPGVFKAVRQRGSRSRPDGIAFKNAPAGSLPAWRDAVVRAATGGGGAGKAVLARSTCFIFPASIRRRPMWRMKRDTRVSVR